MGCVYHGSSVPNLKIINKNKSTHMKEWVYATNSKVIATIFLSSWHSDLYYFLSGDGITSPVQLVERKEGMFKKIFNCDGYIYKLDSSNFKSGLTNWSAEVVSDSNEIVLDSYYIKNVYDELIRLNNNGELKLYLYPNRPDEVPIDNSDLIPKIIRWKQNGFDVNRFYELYPELREKILNSLDE